jgi:hypothetical protein
MRPTNIDGNSAGYDSNDITPIVFRRYCYTGLLTEEILTAFNESVGSVGGDTLTGGRRWLLLSSFSAVPVSKEVSMITLIFDPLELATGQDEIDIAGLLEWFEWHSAEHIEDIG